MLVECSYWSVCKSSCLSLYSVYLYFCMWNHIQIHRYPTIRCITNMLRQRVAHAPIVVIQMLEYYIPVTQDFVHHCGHVFPIIIIINRYPTIRRLANTFVRHRVAHALVVIVQRLEYCISVTRDFAHHCGHVFSIILTARSSHESVCIPHPHL